MKDVNDFDILKFFEGFRNKETKQEVTELYIQGKINKEEYINRMNNART